MGTRLASMWVDFNSRKEGYVPARLQDADRELAVGDVVYAWDEFEDGLRAPARVVRIDHQAGVALLEVDWDRVQHEDDTATAGPGDIESEPVDLMAALGESLPLPTQPQVRCSQQKA